MKFSSVVVSFFILISGSVFAKDVTLKTFEAPDGKYGYNNVQGEPVISPKFDFASDFNACGIAAVADASGWRYINARNETVIVPFVFDNGPDYFSDGLARFIQNGKIGFMNECGKIVIPAQFDFATSFENGQARICQGCTKTQEGEHTKWIGGVWSTINSQGMVTGSARAD